MSKLSHGRWRKLDAGAFASAVQMYGSGMSLAQTAKCVGVSRQSLWASFRARSIPMRSQRRFGKDNHFWRGGAKAEDAAQNKLEKAVMYGRIQRPDTCEKCGEKPPPSKDGRTAI